MLWKSSDKGGMGKSVEWKPGECWHETRFISALVHISNGQCEHSYSVHEAHGKYKKHLCYGSLHFKCSTNDYSCECTVIGDDFVDIKTDYPNRREKLFDKAYFVLRRRFSCQMKEFELYEH